MNVIVVTNQCDFTVNILTFLSENNIIFTSNRLTHMQLYLVTEFLLSISRSINLYCRPNCNHI